MGKMIQLSTKPYLLVLSLLWVAACNPKPFSSTNKRYSKRADSLVSILKARPIEFQDQDIKIPAYWVGTTNFGIRKPNFVIIHHTAQNSCLETLRTFTIPRTAVSAHYVICKNGIVHHMLNDYLRAQHAGISKWGNLIDINSSSIGIELDNNGFEPFDSLQMKSLVQLLAKLKTEFSIPTANFIGHGDIAPTRKNDPNYRFPWKKLAENGFGIWQDESLSPIPANFNHLQALRIIGYDIKDTTAAIRSFKRHFLQDTTRSLNDTDKMVLYNLQQKSM